MNIISKNWDQKALLHRLWNHFCTDSLFRNSVYLIISTGVMAGLGFFFWIIVARLYPTEQIGLATTMISIMGLITSFSLLGINIGIIRYLPKAKKKNDQINTSFAITALATFVVLIFFFVGLKTFSPKLLFIRENTYYVLLFIIFTIFSTASSLIDNIFIAFRNTKFVLIKNTIFSILKLAVPIFLIAMGAYGIFVSVGMATTISFLFGAVLLIWKFNYSFKPTIHIEVVKNIFKFSLGNYVASFIGGLPLLIIPLFILNSIGARFSAYFYMDSMIAGFLYIIPTATSQSLFAESSYEENELETHLLKSIKITALILVPVIILILISSQYILLVFGKQYSTEGVVLLRLLTLSSVFVSINLIFESLLRLKKNIKMIISINLIEALATLLLIMLFISRGLTGIGLSILIGQGIASLFYLYAEKDLSISIARKIIITIIPFIKERSIWSIGIYEGYSPFSLKSPDNIKNPIITAKDVTDIEALFVADPFMLKDKGKWLLFFEVLNKKNGRGEISYASSEDGYKWKYEKSVLKEKYHLSYPYVFKWDNEFYMVPETIETQTIRLYRASSYPDQWVFIKNLLAGENYSDPSLVYFNDTWWMFSSNEKNDILRLHFSKNLFGEWKQHPKSPLLTNNPSIARPGGRVLCYENHLYRYTQDCSPTYGNKIRAFKITEITETNYTEEPIEINPPISASNKGWNANGMHTVDPHLNKNVTWIAAVDGKRYSLYFKVPE